MFKTLLKFADLDGDGKISIYEYFLVGRFLQMVEGDLNDFFKNETEVS